MTHLAELFSVDWVGVGNKLVALVQKEGVTAVDAIKNLLLGIKAVTGKDFPGVWVAVNAEIVDVKELVATIKEEFGN